MVSSSEEFQKLFAANVTAATITPPVPTTTAPAGDGVYDVEFAGRSERTLRNELSLVFYGTRTAADNETFTTRVTGWRRIGTLWIPVPLVKATLTQGQMTGVAGQTVSNTEYFADTIVLTLPSAAGTLITEAISPADDSIAALPMFLPLGNFDRIQVQLAKGTNASCNALAASY